MHYPCPSCGNEVAVGEKCPVCPIPKGLKSQSKANRKGRPTQDWEQNSTYDGTNIPDETDWLEGSDMPETHQTTGLAMFWKVIGTLILLALLARILGNH